MRMSSFAPVSTDPRLQTLHMHVAERHHIYLSPLSLALNCRHTAHVNRRLSSQIVFAPLKSSNIRHRIASSDTGPDRTEEEFG